MSVPLSLSFFSSRGNSSTHSGINTEKEKQSLARFSSGSNQQHQSPLPHPRQRAMTSPTSADEQATTKAGLKAWWSAFTKGKGKDKRDADQRVFGVPLRKSLKYASVAISMAGEDGNQYIWGYVPVVVAKIGLYLKENATEVEGVFRIAGSQKRMKELVETFDTPPRYGKSVDWSKYSIHDAASVLRRYFNQMPEPIVPLDLYSEFRNVMAKEPFDIDSAIKTYRLLITSSPPANQYLLLYVLDLLAVFARKSDKNLMPASNLAVIFQPGMFSHPSHIQSPFEHKLAVQVLEFLIEHQDHFVLGMSPPVPTNFNLDELTAVSRPFQDDEILEPSDSDEELGELEVHEGGGARLLGRSLTQRPPKAGEKKRSTSRRLRGAALVGESADSGPSSGKTSSRENVAALSPSSMNTDVIQVFGEGSAPAVKSSASSLSGGGATGIRRSKTAPSRRVGADGVVRKSRKPRAPAGTAAAKSGEQDGLALSSEVGANVDTSTRGTSPQPSSSTSFATKARGNQTRESSTSSTGRLQPPDSLGLQLAGGSRVEKSISSSSASVSSGKAKSAPGTTAHGHDVVGLSHGMKIETIARSSTKERESELDVKPNEPERPNADNAGYPTPPPSKIVGRSDEESMGSTKNTAE
ncbi:Rho GTPase activation protein [Violaceomyces palustris]|uniref:Rho GTPase activation protein n=1 Tax=Violaceomyces palustris TaxID=1673888 RepID=A0ACD0NXV8_9BASI|nr:Rho GTPase activation protein [Violaceomyces palustris]